MRSSLQPTIGVLLLGLSVSWAGAALANPYASAEEGPYLQRLFQVTEEASVLNGKVLRWFLYGPTKGLYPSDYLARAEHLRTEVETLEPPPRLVPVHRYVSEALGLQTAFVAEWFQAIEQNRPFASPLTDEYAYHEGLHRSHRLLLKSYAELRALFPDAGPAAHRRYRERLRALDFR